MNLPEIQPVPASCGAPPDCMVIVPARNEAKSIARCVASFPEDTVLVVDDGSDDRTADAAKQAGAGVLRALPVPRGGIGKTHACAAGAQALDTTWILFADADSWYEPGFLEAAIARAESDGCRLLSICLDTGCQGLWDHILAPYASALFFSAAPVKEGLAPLFSGQCVLARREEYEFIGGYGRVLRDFAADYQLADVAQRHRLKIGVARARRLGHVRMYAGWKDAWSTIERQAARSLIISTRSCVLILVTAFAAVLWLPLLIRLLLEPHYVWATALALFPILLLRGWYRGWAHALLAPVSMLAMFPVLLHGAVSTVSGRIQWKGRPITP